MSSFYEEACERDGEGARVGLAHPCAELEQLATQQRRREHSASFNVELVQQQVQCSTQAFGAHDVVEDVEAHHIISWHETSEYRPESKKKRKTHLERSLVRRDRSSRRKMREESAQASCRPSGKQLVVTPGHPKPRTRPAIRRDEIAERHDAQEQQQAARLEVDIDLSCCPCHKQARGQRLNGQRLPWVGSVGRAPLVNGCNGRAVPSR